MIYVDDLKQHGWKLKGKYVDSCHLWADDSEELINFGESIGLKPQWLQTACNGLKHFDLVASVRVKAVRAGAQECNDWEAVASWRRITQSIKALQATPGKRVDNPELSGRRA